MRNRRILIGLVAVLFSFPVIAQDSLTSVKDIKKQARTESADTLSGIWSQNWILKLKPHNGGYQLDTVSVLYEKYFGVLNYLNDPATPERYIAYNPDYYRLFVPTTYYYAPMERLSQVNWTFQKQDTVPAMTKELLPFDTLSFLSKENANRVVDRVMMNTYVNRPDLVEMTEKEIKKQRYLRTILKRRSLPNLPLPNFCPRENNWGERRCGSCDTETQLVGNRWKRFITNYAKLYL